MVSISVKTGIIIALTAISQEVVVKTRCAPGSLRQQPEQTARCQEHRTCGGKLGLECQLPGACKPLIFSRKPVSSSARGDSVCGAPPVSRRRVMLGEAPHSLPITFTPTCTQHENAPKGRNSRAYLLTVVWAADKGSQIPMGRLEDLIANIFPPQGDRSSVCSRLFPA